MCLFLLFVFHSHYDDTMITMSWYTGTVAFRSRIGQPWPRTFLWPHGAQFENP